MGVEGGKGEEGGARGGRGEPARSKEQRTVKLMG